MVNAVAAGAGKFSSFAWCGSFLSRDWPTRDFWDWLWLQRGSYYGQWRSLSCDFWNGCFAFISYHRSSLSVVFLYDKGLQEEALFQNCYSAGRIWVPPTNFPFWQCRVSLRRESQEFHLDQQSRQHETSSLLKESSERSRVSTESSPAGGLSFGLCGGCRAGQFLSWLASGLIHSLCVS